MAGFQVFQSAFQLLRVTFFVFFCLLVHCIFVSKVVNAGPLRRSHWDWEPGRGLGTQHLTA